MAAAARSSPFKGLDPYGRDDAAYFAGRERDVRLIAANALTSASLLVYGPSGVGKSSVLMAGVVPRLREKPGVLAAVCRDWSGDAVAALGDAIVAAAREAEHEPKTAAPLADLLWDVASTMRTRIVLVLDQFEDHLARGAAADALVAELAVAISNPELPLSVLISIREESLARLDRFEGWVPEMFDSVYRLDPLDREAGEQAIRDPLTVWNRAEPEQRMEVEDAFVAALLDQVPNAAGPRWVETAHLQLVMERAWEAEEAAGSHLLRHETLERLGGAEAIVRDHVERALGSLDDREQALASVVLDRLVTPTGVRVPHSAGDLAVVAGVPEADVQALLEELADARVIRPVARPEGGEAFEVFHASLADAALAWRTGFVADQRAAQERRRARRLAVVAVVLAVVLAGVAALAVYAWTTRQTARSQANASVALAQIGIDPALALSLALAAVEAKETPGSLYALRTALQGSHERHRLVGYSVDFAADGVLSAGVDGTVRLWDPVSGRELRTIAKRQDEVFEAVFCPDAQRVAVAAGDGAAIIADGREIPLDHGNAQAETIACSRDGARIATADSNGVVRTFDADGRPTVLRIARRVYDVVWSPNGRYLALLAGAREGGGPGAVLIRDVEAGRQVREVAFDVGGSVAVTDEAKLAIGDSEGRVLVDGPDGGASPGWQVGQHELLVNAVAFSPDGSLVASAGRDETVRVGAVAGALEIGALRGHVGPVADVAFAPDGKAVASAGQDGTVRIWTVPSLAIEGDGEDVRAVAGGRDVVALLGKNRVRVLDVPTGTERGRVDVSERSESVLVGPDAEHVVAVSDGLVSIHPLEGGRPVELGSAFSAAFAPDGKTIAVGGSGGVRIVGLDGRTKRRLTVPNAPIVSAVAFAPAGDRLAVATFPSGVLSILDPSTGRRLVRFEVPQEGGNGIAFSPDGRRLVTVAGGTRDVRVWDARSGKLLRELRGGHGSGIRRAEFSPDGGLVLTVGLADGRAVLWDVETGRRVSTFAATDASFVRGPSGTSLVVGGPGQTARVLPCEPCGSPDELRERAKQRITRSAEERDAALG